MNKDGRTRSMVRGETAMTGKTVVTTHGGMAARTEVMAHFSMTMIQMVWVTVMMTVTIIDFCKSSPQ